MWFWAKQIAEAIPRGLDRGALVMTLLTNEDDSLAERIMDWMTDKLFIWMIIIIIPALVASTIWMVTVVVRNTLFPPTKFSLIVKEWQCVEYEQVRSYVSTGKVIVPTYRDVCVTYHKVGAP